MRMNDLLLVAAIWVGAYVTGIVVEKDIGFWWLIPLSLSVVPWVICDLRLERRKKVIPIQIVFDGPPNAVMGRFVEGETLDGKSINVGEWKVREDGLWVLTVSAVVKQWPYTWRGDDDTSSRC